MRTFFTRCHNKSSYVSLKSPSNGFFNLNSKHHCGFTILELLISTSIFAITMSIALPNISTYKQNTELKTTALAMQKTLTLARSHALYNQVTVIVCQMSKADPEKCVPERKRYDNWQQGWLGYADLNANNELDDTDHIISSHQNNSSVTVIFNQNGRLRFFPRGSARSAGFYFCNSQTNNAQYVRLLHTGRNRISSKLSRKQHLKCKNLINKPAA